MSAVQHSAQDLTRMARRVRPITTSIFATMSRLAVEHKAVNLSQGFPDFPTPEWLKEAAEDAIARNTNQYAVDHGSARIRRAIGAKAERRMGLRVDENLDATVTSGAT